MLTITAEEMVEIPGITVPGIRAVLCVQNKIQKAQCEYEETGKNGQA